MIHWPFTGRQRGVEESIGHRDWLAGHHLLLHPDGVDPIKFPVGEEANAVAGGHNRIEMLIQMAHRQLFVDILADRKGGQQVKRHFGHHA